jgi:hypothetical protein
MDTSCCISVLLLNQQVLSSFQGWETAGVARSPSRARYNLEPAFPAAINREEVAMAKKVRKKPAKKRWSQRVTETSDAMTLENGVFKKTPRALAMSLKRSADRSTRRKSSPFRSAMSMLTFYENRAGKNLSATRRAKIDKAKDELRALYHKD